MLGCSPVKLSAGARDRAGYGKRKMRAIEGAAKIKVAKLLNLTTSELEMSSTKGQSCNNYDNDFKEMISSLKSKSDISTKQEKIKLLTLIPSSWTIKETTKKFEVSERLVKRARELKRSKGILAEPNQKRGKPLDAEVAQKVINFYQSDEFSRMCPGKKEYISVWVDGIKIQQQKRLLLTNLKELLIEYLKATGDKIGFSKFCELRPKWCVTVNSKGMHSVCVCEQHQNAKLLVAALPGPFNYKDLLAELVCDTTRRNCMLQYCSNCPGRQQLRNMLQKLLEENDIECEDQVKYKQWLHTDGTKLVDLHLPHNEYMDLLLEKFDFLRHHHFIAKSQSEFLQITKDTLADDAVIILLDFAENYSFLVQDAVQGYHWDNSQATLHPFCVYFKEAGDLKCLNMCVISDCMRHDTNTVHAFSTKALHLIKHDLPLINKVTYFSDGAASQNKNFINLCHH